jgi:hypothetical protein
MVDMSKLSPWGTTTSASNPYASDNNWQSTTSGLAGSQASTQPTGQPQNVLNQTAPAGGYNMDNSGFNYPVEWGNLAAGWKGFGKIKADTPTSWQTGMGALTPMAQTGQPVSSDPWWQATQDVTNRTIQDQIKMAAEQAGLGGTRWSTPLGYTAQDIAGRYGDQAAQAWADREMQAQEAAKARQLEATGQLFNYGQGQYQMQKDAIARRAQMLAGMGNLGAQKAQLALQVANQMYGMGSGMQDQQQQAINASYNNPYMNYANQYMGQQQTGLPQTYQPSLGTQALGAASSVAPWLMSGLGGGGNSQLPNSSWNTQDVYNQAPANMDSYTWG